MTENANLKRRVRARAARTGESYMAARRQLVGAQLGSPAQVVLATAQMRLRPDPSEPGQLQDGGARVRALMHDAGEAGAALVHFPEGALCSPHKRAVSSKGPDVVAESDWGRVDRATLRAELDRTARLARELELWVAVGGIQVEPGCARPTNALFVISDRGTVVGRYDERMLSRTKSLYMYRAGTRPLTFTVGGVRFGSALGIETHYPELFAAYERDDVDCVLVSTAGNPEHPDVFAVEAAGHAAAQSLWVSLAGPVGSQQPPAGLANPHGTWITHRPAADEDAIVAAQIDTATGRPSRTWRRLARERNDPGAQR